MLLWCWIYIPKAGAPGEHQDKILLFLCLYFCPQKMAMFRSLLFTGEGEDPACMMDNYRPPQGLKGRCVRASFK